MACRMISNKITKIKKMRTKYTHFKFYTTIKKKEKRTTVNLFSILHHFYGMIKLPFQRPVVFTHLNLLMFSTSQSQTTACHLLGNNANLQKHTQVDKKMHNSGHVAGLINVLRFFPSCSFSPSVVFVTWCSRLST